MIISLRILISLLLTYASASQLNPVLLIPGDGGSRMDAILHKEYSIRYLCSKITSDWFNIWLNLELLIPYVIDCWVDNVKLSYDNLTHKSYNTKGVEIRVPFFGDTNAVEWLDPSKRSYSRYFANIAESLVNLGLDRGTTLRGAPYDFRKTPMENTEMMANLKILIEDMRKSTGRPIVVVCHSMGCLYMKYFLQTQSMAWKRNHLKDWITLSAPWAGTVKALKVYASGDNLDEYPLNAHKIRDVQRTYPSLSWLVPRAEYWPTDQTLVSTPFKNYTIAHLGNFFIDLGIPEAYEMWVDNRNLIDLMFNNGMTHSNKISKNIKSENVTKPLQNTIHEVNKELYESEPLGVQLHCLHGVNVSTPELLTWPLKTFPDKQPQITYGDGDGSVNERSLSACVKFHSQDGIENHVGKGDQNSGPNENIRVIHKQFSGIEHVHMLYDPSIIAYILYVVSDGRNGTNYPNITYIKKDDKRSLDTFTLNLSLFNALFFNNTLSSSTHPLFMPVDTLAMGAELELLTQAHERRLLLAKTGATNSNGHLTSNYHDPNSKNRDKLVLLDNRRNTYKIAGVLFFYTLGLIFLALLVLFLFKVVTSGMRLLVTNNINNNPLATFPHSLTGNGDNSDNSINNDHGRLRNMFGTARYRNYLSL